MNYIIFWIFCHLNDTKSRNISLIFSTDVSWLNVSKDIDKSPINSGNTKVIQQSSSINFISIVFHARVVISKVSWFNLVFKNYEVFCSEISP